MQTRKTYQEAVGRVKPIPPPLLTQEEILNRQARNEWLQESQTKELIQFLLRREKELNDLAQVAAQQDKKGKVLARLLNQSKTVKDILDYVRTGK